MGRLKCQALSQPMIEPIHDVVYLCLRLKTKKYSMTQTTEHPYIVTDDQILGGEPIVKDTRTPVRAIVEIWRLGTHPEEIPNHLPHLSLGQIFDALSYYSDHQEEIQKYIEENRVPPRLIDPLVQSTQ